MTRVTLYTQPGCHLCDDARRVLEAVRDDFTFELEEIDIRTDSTLRKRYRERIPVVSIDGVERFDLGVDERALRAELAGAPESPAVLKTKP
jgi:glutaredoxin